MGNLALVERVLYETWELLWRASWIIFTCSSNTVWEKQISCKTSAASMIFPTKANANGLYHQQSFLSWDVKSWLLSQWHSDQPQGKQPHSLRFHSPFDAHLSLHRGSSVLFLVAAPITFTNWGLSCNLWLKSHFRAAVKRSSPLTPQRELHKESYREWSNSE